METLISQLAGSGVMGTILAYFLYRNAKLTDTIITLVENNTKAMTTLEKSVGSLAEAQNRRRKEFKNA